MRFERSRSIAAKRLLRFTLIICMAFVIVATGIVILLILHEVLVPRRLRELGAVYQIHPLYGVTMVAFISSDHPAGDDDLTCLQGMKSLRYLYLQQTTISSNGLRHLRTLKRLRHLVITSDRLTEDEVRELGDELPRCVIVLQHPVDGIRCTIGTKNTAHLGEKPPEN